MRKLLVTLLATALVPTGAEARSVFKQYCQGKDPTTLLNHPADPASLDPRRLATHDNGYTSEWQNCHTEAAAALEPKTCGEWLDAVGRGGELLLTRGLIGSFFDADTYNKLWRAWGLTERPADFDRRIVERYGLQPMPAGVRNPYPLPGQKPIPADGGSGELPMGLVQTRDASGHYDGGIGFTCLLCHAGRIGSPGDGEGLGSRLGIGNTTFDVEVLSYDLGKTWDQDLQGGVPIPLPYPHSEGRGTIDAVEDFEFLMAVRDFDTLNNTPFVKTFPAHASPGDQDPPAWHNTGSRPRVYMDGGVSSDNTRALMQFLAASITTNTCSGERAENEQIPGCGDWIKKQERDFEAIRVYIDSIEPPPFPGPVDHDCNDDGVCAERGEAIFHTRDLFSGHPPAPIEGSNGSCSSCHGVYSPAYASQLRDSRLVGIAGQIVPRDVILTDPGRVDTLSRELRWGWGTLWFAYADNSADDPFTEAMNDFVTPESNGLFGPDYTREQGTCGWVAVDGAGNLDERRVGYAAPALHGLWSTAPYFHNGSVPTVYHVLRPAKRPTHWRRPLTCDPLIAGTDCGFDVSLTAYHFDHLGWKFDCLGPDGAPLDDCLPGASAPLAAARPATPQSHLWVANQSPRPVTQADVELRKIYDTTRYGRSNAGHNWTSGLDPVDPAEPEVRSLIEYLKTL
jgi:hypothetical protein